MYQDPLVPVSNNTAQIYRIQSYKDSMNFYEFLYKFNLIPGIFTRELGNTSSIN
jgi:hypothetical protein